MSKQTFTPGPWTATWSINEWIIESRLGKYIGGLMIGNAESRANARLIAAAPDLLETLAELVDGMSDVEDSESGVLFRARAAIAKATGSAE